MEARVSDLTISAITLWEAHLLMERKRIVAVATPESTIDSWLRTYPVSVAPVTAEIAVLSRSLRFDHEDPADRFIAATAHALGMPLATADAHLCNLPWLQHFGAD